MSSRILLVDDESVIRALSRHVSREYEVHLALDGKVALEPMEHHSFAVVVSDIRMPGISGSDIVARARRRWADTQYLFLTGNQQTEADQCGEAAPTSNEDSAPEVHRLKERC